MKKYFLLLLSVVFFITACTKEEKTITTITGQLYAGENVTAEDLIGLPLALCQFKSDGDISNTNVDSSIFDIIDIVTLDELGEFEFANISPGNYFFGLNGFIFPTDSVCHFRFDGTEALNIKQTINRNPAENIIPIFSPCRNDWARIDMENYSGPELTFIRLYGENSYGESMTSDHTVEIIEGTIQCLPVTVAVEYLDGTIHIAFNYSLMRQCYSDYEAIKPIYFILGFADGNGGTVYSEKIKLRRYLRDGSCEGLPQTIGQTTISFKPGTGYVLTNN